MVLDKFVNDKSFWRQALFLIAFGVVSLEMKIINENVLVILRVRNARYQQRMRGFESPWPPMADMGLSFVSTTMFPRLHRPKQNMLNYRYDLETFACSGNIASN